jgi:threonine/homoserine/homoserine lactone efflux protein
MGFDGLLVSALILGLLSIVSVTSALIEGRRPKVALFAALVAGLLGFMALGKSGDGLQITDIPDAFVVVVAGFVD